MRAGVQQAVAIGKRQDQCSRRGLLYAQTMTRHDPGTVRCNIAAGRKQRRRRDHDTVRGDKAKHAGRSGRRYPPSPGHDRAASRGIQSIASPADGLCLRCASRIKCDARNPESNGPRLRILHTEFRAIRGPRMRRLRVVFRHLHRKDLVRRLARRHRQANWQNERPRAIRDHRIVYSKGAPDVGRTFEFR